MKAVLASKNQKKLKELREILTDFDITVLLQSEVGVDVDVEETGDTFEENAKLKAEAVRDASRTISISDDSGLVVEALDGEPGVYSARYGGEDLTDTERWQLLLEKMQGKENRSAKFVSVICCAFPNGDLLFARGECLGEIATQGTGDGGFGYDPVFYLPDLGKTMAQLTAEEKHKISHRGNALRVLKTELENYLNGTKQ